MQLLKVLLAVSATALTLPATPAGAHGTCTTTVSDYSYSGSTTNGRFTWSGRISCGELHYGYYVRACLERLDYTYTPPQFWEVSCAEAWEPGQVRSLRTDGSYDTSPTNPCVPGTYRVYAVGSAGNGGYHWDVPYAYSAPSLELCNAI